MNTDKIVSIDSRFSSKSPGNIAFYLTNSIIVIIVFLPAYSQREAFITPYLLIPTAETVPVHFLVALVPLGDPSVYIRTVFLLNSTD